MEQWVTHADCDPAESTLIINILPVIQRINKMFPNDTIFVDYSRVDLLFDDKGKPILDRWDSNSEFWTPQNPLPINAISDDAELLNLWKSKHMYTKQTQSHVEWLMKIRNNNADTICIIVQNVIKYNVLSKEDDIALKLQGCSPGSQLHYIPKGREVKKPLLTCYIIQTLRSENAKSANILLTPTPNSQFNHYCRHCGKVYPKLMCSACEPKQASQQVKTYSKTYSKLGTYYCDRTCQKADWTRHKKECGK